MIDLTNPAQMFLVCLFILVLIAWTAWSATDEDGSFFRVMPPFFVGLVFLLLLGRSLMLMIVSQLSSPPASAQRDASAPAAQESPSD